MQGKTILRDTDKRAESPELRLKYVPRFQKLLRQPQAQEVLEILRRYGRDCIPIPRQTGGLSHLPLRQDAFRRPGS